MNNDFLDIKAVVSLLKNLFHDFKISFAITVYHIHTKGIYRSVCLCSEREKLD